MLNLTTTAPIRQIELCNDHSCHDDRPSFQIGMPSIHGHRIDNDKRTISVPRMIVIDQKTNVARTKAVTDIVKTDIDQTMTMTETTGTNHSIHGTIDITLIKVRAIIDGPPTTVAESLTLNLEGLSHTLNRGTIRTTNGLTPRLHVSPLTAHTIPLKTSEAKPTSRRRSLVLNVTNLAITLPNFRPMIEVKHLP